MKFNDAQIVGNVPIRYLKQVENLLKTPVGSLALDRDFGINMSFIDQIPPVAKQLYIAEVIKKIKKYIPAFKVDSIDFVQTEDISVLKPIVKIIVRS